MISACRPRDAPRLRLRSRACQLESQYNLSGVIHYRLLELAPIRLM
jgi:hypothetical protein